VAISVAEKMPERLPILKANFMIAPAGTSGIMVDSLLTNER
jgi:hypothetical protein